MKIVKVDQEFKPVSIVLESQDEVNWLYELMGKVGGGGPVRKFVDDVYYGLEEIKTAGDNDENFRQDHTLQIK